MILHYFLKTKSIPMLGPNSGFTLMELIMVIVVVGLMAASAISILPDEVDRVARARRLAGDIRLAQSYAMSLGKDYKIHIRATGDDSYEIYDEKGHAWPSSEVKLSKVTISSFDIKFDHKVGKSKDAVSITVADRVGTTKIQVLKETGVVLMP